MATTEENRRYNEGRRQRGYIRGPWISAEAREALRNLCFYRRKKPCDVVSELIVECWRRMQDPSDPIGDAMRKHGFSEFEAREFVRSSDAQ
jgi:hypothetical protein